MRQIPSTSLWQCSTGDGLAGGDWYKLTTIDCANENAFRKANEDRRLGKANFFERREGDSPTMRLIFRMRLSEILDSDA